MINLLFTIEKIGPYHNARYNKISESKDFNLNVLETNTSSKRYPWRDPLNKNYNVFDLPQKKGIFSKFKNSNNVLKILKKTVPDIVYINGWHENISFYLIFICQLKKIPVVIFSDSRFRDSKRIIFLELIKKLLLKGCSSAVVAGKESENYLIRLGFKKEKIFKPLDVIDNKYFSSKNSSKIKNNYILCVARFIKRKNHIAILNAFESYKKKGGQLNLILIGSGPEKENIINAKEQLSNASNISIESWKDISELKEYYSNAKVFVLLSNVDQWGLVINEAMASGLPCIVSYGCGCYFDLVKDKKTGWGIDPKDKDRLANIFYKVDKIEEKEFIKRQKNCLKIINDYSLDKFSDAIKNSSSLTIKKRKFSRISLLTAYLLFIFK